jgi:5-methylcytosine-specific restriction endonuclease McrA
MARKEFPDSVKKAALIRASKATGFPCCEQCGAMIKKGRQAFDHINPDGLTGEPTLENCQVLCDGPGSCHARKTRQDVSNIARAKRREAADMGIKKRSRWPTSKTGAWKQKIGGQIVPRHQ